MDDYVSKPMAADALDRLLRWAPRPGAPARAHAQPDPGPSRPALTSTSPSRRPTPIARAPAIDPGALDKLRASAQGEPDIVAEVIALFLQEAPERMVALRDGGARGRPRSPRRAAHTLGQRRPPRRQDARRALRARSTRRLRAGRPFNVAFAVAAIEEELDRVRDALIAESSACAPELQPLIR